MPTLRALVAIALLTWDVSLFAAPAAPAAPPAPTTVTVLDTGSMWRTYYWLRPAAARKDGAVETLDMGAKWLNRDTEPPAAGWAQPDFDDSSWARVPAGVANLAWRGMSGLSPEVALECRRGKFEITEAARVGDLTLTLSYAGGAVVYLNGTEIARGNLARAGAAAPDALADDYPPEAAGKMELLAREVADVRLPQALLRKGTNVLAIELHRAAYREGEIGKDARGRMTVIRWGNCGLVSVRLTAEKGDSPPTEKGTVPFFARPKGFQVWNSDATASDFDLDWGDPRETLKPITLAAARNGSASGKVVIGSDSAVKALKATAGALVRKGGAGVIPPSAVEVRYAMPWGGEHGTQGRYPVAPTRLDALDEMPPAEVGVCEKALPRGSRLKPEELEGMLGAVCAVWVTVNVPADAAPGDYEGALTITADGQKPAAVPIALRVSAWKLPEPRDFRAVVEFIQSPDTLALEYDVPLWSDRHFALIEKSFRLLAQTGCRTAYVPLLAETNLGNAESMVRWIPKGDGTYAFDFTVMDRYLDIVQKHGKPEALCLAFWEVYLERVGYLDVEPYVADIVKQDRTAHRGQGPIVTRLDPATGKTEPMVLPEYSDAKSKGLWGPMCEQLRARLKARGLERAAMIGFSTDAYPTEAVVTLFKELMPGAPWYRASHSGGLDFYKAPLKYRAHVWPPRFAGDPESGRHYGWKAPSLTLFFLRGGFDPFPMTGHRVMSELAMGGSERGVGRLGGDLWSAMKDKKGRRAGRVTEGRYPKSSWRALNIVTGYLAPGADGPVATARYEMVREGLQECEARIVIEQALTDTAAREKLGEPLAARAQALLDERMIAALRGASSFIFGEHFTINAADNHAWWHLPGPLGAQWFVSSGWQDRRLAVFDMAAEVERATAGLK